MRTISHVMKGSFVRVCDGNILEYSLPLPRMEAFKRSKQLDKNFKMNFQHNRSVDLRFLRVGASFIKIIKIPP